MSPGAAPPWFDRLVHVVPTLRDSPFPRLPLPADVRLHRSAVLVLFGPGDGDPGGPGPDLLLTERSASLRAHAGQVSFPGGRIDAGDAGPEAAALREAGEETGLDPAGVRVAATGPELQLVVTGFVVTPVIGWWERPSPVGPVDPAEVARVVRVPVAELLDPANRFLAVHPSGFVGPAFEVGDVYVWGFTAGVLSWLLSVAGLERPWDASRRRPVPERYLNDRGRWPSRPEGPAGPSADVLADELAGELGDQVDGSPGRAPR